MKVNLKKVLCDIEGNPMKRISQDGKDADLTVGDIAVQGLLEQSTQETALTAEEKLNRWMLAHKVHDSFEAGEVDLTTDEIVKIKHCANMTFVTKVFAPFAIAIEQS